MDDLDWYDIDDESDESREDWLPCDVDVQKWIDLPLKQALFEKRIKKLKRILNDKDI